MIIFSEIVEANGKTIRENNMERKHNIPLGTVVRATVNQADWDTPEVVRQTITGTWYVAFHGRDCDGTPLYGITGKQFKDGSFQLDMNNIWSKLFFNFHFGFTEEDLEIVSI